MSVELDTNFRPLEVTGERRYLTSALNSARSGGIVSFAFRSAFGTARPPVTFEAAVHPISARRSELAGTDRNLFKGTHSKEKL